MHQASYEQIAKSSALLGCGGQQPGIRLVCSGGTETQPLLGLPAGASVYALDVDAEAGLVAFGTRDGQVSLAWRDTSDLGKQEWHKRALPQGAPVLAVCLFRNRRLISSDVAGRCLLWPHQLSPDARPKMLDMRGGSICSLCDLGTGRVLGLSSQGTVHLWDVPSGRLRQTGDGPRPAPTYGLVHLTPWTGAHAIAYPSERGDLVLVCPDTLATTSYPGHEGGFYALAALDRQLITVGCDDGRMAIWTASAAASAAAVAPDRHLSAPSAVIGCSALSDGESSRVLLVHTDGRASLHTIDDVHLHHECFLNGTYHRVVITTRSDSVAVNRARLHEDQRALRAVIAQKINAREFSVLEDLFRKVDSDRYPLAVLGLRAQEAAAKEDVLAELRFRKALIDSLPTNDTRSTASVRRYIHLLLRMCLFAEADEVRRSASPPGQGVLDNVHSDHLTAVWSALRSSYGCMIAGLRPEALRLAVQAADVLGVPLVGKWIIEESKPIAFPYGEVDGGSIVTKYEASRAEHGLTGLPHANATSLWRVARERLERLDAVVFGAGPGSGTPRLGLAVCLRHDDLQPVIVRAVFLDAGGQVPLNEVTQHNRRLLTFLRDEMGQVLEGPWLSSLKQTVNQALKRLTSQALAMRSSRQEIQPCRNM